MTISGHVENGVVILEAGVRLREGARVRVELMEFTEATGDGSQEMAKLRTGLAALSGSVKDAPADLARNHDHYAHGTPRP